MSDIVKRLREAVVVDAFASGRLTNGVLAERLIRERHEAADEIERLRSDISFLSRAAIEANERNLIQVIGPP